MFKQILVTTRLGNLLIIAISQFLAAHHLFEWKSFSNISLTLLILATIFTALGGYIFNDLKDLPSDAVNKPKKNIFANTINSKWGIKLYIISIIITLFFAFANGSIVGFFVVFMVFLQWLYSAYLKGTVLWGNVLVALSQAAVFVLVYIWAYSQNSISLVSSGYLLEAHSNYIFFFSIFAFLCGFFREIVKDVQDIEGDKLQGYATFPVQYSLNEVLSLLKILAVLLIIGVISVTFYFLYILNNQNVLSYYYLFVMIPVNARLWVFFNKKDDKQVWLKLSQWIKIIMLAGVVSIYFI